VPLEMTEGNYSNVGHRGPVYKGLGAINPCDNLIYMFLALMDNYVAVYKIYKIRSCYIVSLMIAHYDRNV
jgi:hypothetical protein